MRIYFNAKELQLRNNGQDKVTVCYLVADGPKTLIIQIQVKCFHKIMVFPKKQETTKQTCPQKYIL